MPRKSAASMTVHPVIDVRQVRLSPPEHLNPAAAAVWRDLVAAVGPDHFTRADVALLEQYSVAAVTARRAAEALERDGEVIGGRASPWLVVQEKSVRALTALAARLRVCPQSRFDRLKAGSTAKRQGEHADPIAALLAIQRQYEGDTDE